MFQKTLCLLAIATLLLGGCGKKAEEKRADRIIESAIEKESGGKAKVDLSEKKVSIQTEEGKFEVANGDAGIKTPDDFPKDIFIYPGATVKTSMKSKDGSQLMLETADALAKVTESYKAKMKEGGWTEDSSAMMGEMTMLTFKKDKRNVMVHLGSQDGKTTSIMLMLTEEAPPTAPEPPEAPQPEQPEPAPAPQSNN